MHLFIRDENGIKIYFRKFNVNTIQSRFTDKITQFVIKCICSFYFNIFIIFTITSTATARSWCVPVCITILFLLTRRTLTINNLRLNFLTLFRLTVSLLTTRLRLLNISNLLHLFLRLTQFVQFFCCNNNIFKCLSVGNQFDNISFFLCKTNINEVTNLEMQIDTVCKIHLRNIFILKAEEVFI